MSPGWFHLEVECWAWEKQGSCFRQLLSAYNQFDVALTYIPCNPMHRTRSWASTPALCCKRTQSVWKMHSCQVELQYSLVGPRWCSVAPSWLAAWHEYTELHGQVYIQVYTVWCSLWCSIWCGEWRWRFSIQQSLPDSYIRAPGYVVQFTPYSWHIQVLFHSIPLAQEWD